jgi:hypothetical protein
MGLAPIPLRTQIVDSAGTIVEFFRLRWEELRTLTGVVAAKAVFSVTGRTAAIASQLLYTAVAPGLYAVTFSARRTAVDGAASSLTFTWHWTDGGVPLSDSATVNTTDTTGSLYSATRLLPVDVNTNLTCDMAYTSTTPAKMTYKLDVVVALTAQA